MPSIHQETWGKTTYGRFAAAIASTATLLGLELVTTDADFAHLHNVFLEVRQIYADDLKQYF
jgi:predicted nucleic acid-binding protein